jgi:elongation factor Ts
MDETMTPTITAKDVAELRARTGAGMMDCKKALEEAGGDMSRAAEFLRAKGIAKAEKRAGRSTSQGLVLAAVNAEASAGAIIELTSETDFVARNEDFIRAAEALLAQALAGASTDLAGFLAQPSAASPGRTVEEMVKEVSGKTGESVILRNMARFAPGATGTVGLYQHFNKQVAVLVELTSNESVARSDAVQELGREISLHIASADPIAVRPEDIPADLIDRERRIAEEQVVAEGKPEAVRAKIVDGKIRKFVAERTLLEQPWVKDDKKTIGQLVADASKVVGQAITVVRFVRFKVGEA